MNKIIKITKTQKLAAKIQINIRKKINKDIDNRLIKISEAKTKLNPNLPPEETQYILED